MNEWKEYRLGDAPLEIIDGDRGKNYPSQKDFLDEGFCLFLSTKNVTKDKFDFSNSQFITEERDNILRKGKLKRGDTVLTTRGTVGNVAFFNDTIKYENIRINSGMVILRPDENNLYPLYNYFVFRYLQKEFETFTSGSAQPQLPIRDLNQINIALPSLPEQRQLADVLSSLDDKIDLLHRQNETLEKIAETLFRQWFIEEADESWEVKRLSELLTITSSKRIFYSEYVLSGIPFYRSKEIIDLRNTGRTNSELFISSQRFDEITKKFGAPKEGDILMTSVGTLGIPYRVKKSDRFYFKDGNLTWFKDFKGLSSSTVFLWLVSKTGQEYLNSIAIGSTQRALTIETLKKIEFKIPPKNALNNYEKEFNELLCKIESNETQIQTLIQLRDLLLPKLMSGEVRVKMN